MKALVAHLTVPAVPPSPNELKGHHHMEIHRRLKPLKDTTWMLAQSARNEAGWPLPIKTDPPAPRWVGFTLYRNRLLDEDNAWASIKPMLDATKGVLILDDRLDWCRVVRVTQVQVPLGQERTEIEVYLVTPSIEGVKAAVGQ